MLSLLWFSLSLHASPMVVIVDPGHGGKDRGTTKNGVCEAAITLNVSQKLVALLRRDHRFQPYLSREDDSAVSLQQRALYTKKKNGTVFLSVHVNSNPDLRAKGAEFYFQNQLPPDQESMYLAFAENDGGDDAGTQPQPYEFLEHNKYPQEISTIVSDLLDNERILRSSQLTKALKGSWKGQRKGRTNSVRQAPFFVLNQMRVPSALVELGFLTNPEDYKDLTSPSVQQEMAQDLYRGLISYKESMDKTL